MFLNCVWFENNVYQVGLIGVSVTMCVFAHYSNNSFIEYKNTFNNTAIIDHKLFTLRQTLYRVEEMFIFKATSQHKLDDNYL